VFNGLKQFKAPTTKFKIFVTTFDTKTYLKTLVKSTPETTMSETTNDGKFYNINIERTLLSSIIFDPKILEEIKIPLKTDYFYHPAHQAMIKAIVALEAEKLPIAEEFIRTRLMRTDDFNEDAFFDILACSPISNIEPYIAEVAKCYEFRRLDKMLAEARRQLRESDTPTAIKEGLSLDLDNGAVVHDDRTLADWYEYYETQPPMPKFDTGVTIIDQGLDGLEAGQLILVGGDPEAGKTVLSVQILKTIAKYSKAVFFSFEFTVRHFVKKQAYIEGKEWVQTQNNLVVINEGYGIDEVAVKVKKYAKEGVKFFVIDSQMRLEADQGRTVEEEETRKFSVLAKLAHKLELVIILVFQSSKAGDNSPLGSKKAAHESSVTFYLSFPPECVKRHEKDGIEYRWFEVRKNKQNGKRFKELVRLNTRDQTFHMLQKGTQERLLDPKSEVGTVDMGAQTMAMTDDTIEFTHMTI
jgi:DNA repair protein RadA/Sms